MGLSRRTLEKSPLREETRAAQEVEVAGGADHEEGGPDAKSVNEPAAQTATSIFCSAFCGSPNLVGILGFEWRKTSDFESSSPMLRQTQMDRSKFAMDDTFVGGQS